ncbi:hypothetical protein L1N85_22170 [Paenibacillus alkaliterrae]|uniref:hypothetical protein n=1 Tax=Paenibacillus alkaliterrae TaxID=320909 RepID=UPI001F1DF9EF|nr:hypothetical protein [Paenibacillus alkaliterrae]MCF2941096.1 hypothetical protein [Paenibacillus alkaliterrae]
MEEDKLDIGIVTPSGIWFDGKIYSCSWAVRHQWFKHAEFIGGWPVSIRSHEEKPDQIEVILNDGNSVVCIRIDHIPVNSARLDAYYLEFQRLVTLRKQRQAVKETIPEDQRHSDEPTNN